VRGSSMGIKQLYSVESNQISVSRDLLHLALEGQLSLPSSGALSAGRFFWIFLIFRQAGARRLARFLASAWASRGTSCKYRTICMGGRA
jgi:hypothetical protein